uniref:Uncharacterized protein n=1 Tax=Oryza meridionalis TaxID=40149 RepID=A0A0E0EYY6_9ORYZ
MASSTVRHVARGFSGLLASSLPYSCFISPRLAPPPPPISAFAASPLSHTCIAIAIAVIVRTKLCSASAPPPPPPPAAAEQEDEHLISSADRSIRCRVS